MTSTDIPRESTQIKENTHETKIRRTYFLDGRLVHINDSRFLGATKRFLNQEVRLLKLIPDALGLQVSHVSHVYLLFLYITFVSITNNEHV